MLVVLTVVLKMAVGGIDDVCSSFTFRFSIEPLSEHPTNRFIRLSPLGWGGTFWVSKKPSQSSKLDADLFSWGFDSCQRETATPSCAATVSLFVTRHLFVVI